MREIKVRGYAIEKLIVDSQWLVGFGVYEVKFADHYAKEVGRSSDWWIYTDSGEYQVDPKSVGQYTGLKDKNGKEIYEGDVVKSFMQENRGEWRDFKAQGVITYFQNCGQFLIKQENSHPQLGFDLFELDDTEHYEVLELEVIGNIYENPELINS